MQIYTYFLVTSLVLAYSPCDFEGSQNVADIAWDTKLCFSLQDDKIADKTDKIETDCSNITKFNKWQFIIYGKRVWQTFEFHLTLLSYKITRKIWNYLSKS